MKRLLSLCVCAALFAASVPSLRAQEGSPVDPGSVQYIIPQIDAKMKEFVESKEIAGAVTLFAEHDKVLHLSSIGYSDLKEQKPMQIDSIFWIASMTKPITGAAVAKLVEEGKLSIDDPVSKYLPEFKELKLPKEGDKEAKPAVITIKHLLTHSAGLSELSSEEQLKLKELAELTQLVSTKPLKFTPGTKWVYSQTGINSAARVVEVVSGKSFPDFIDETFFKPLGMRDTTFYLNDEQVSRLAKTYKRNEQGELEEAPLSIFGDQSLTSRERVPLANGGLFSTAGDYGRFCQMLLSGGSFKGKQILKPETVQLIGTVHSGDLVTGFTPGNAWGLGVCVVRQPQGVTKRLSPGSAGHGGAYGTQAWMDPVRDRVFVLMVQRANFPNSDASTVREGFQEIAYQVEN
ncbi:MAG: serine hydrolase domain-containing protein [Pirellulales bacterium]